MGLSLWLCTCFFEYVNILCNLFSLHILDTLVCFSTHRHCIKFKPLDKLTFGKKWFYFLTSIWYLWKSVTMFLDPLTNVDKEFNHSPISLIVINLFRKLSWSWFRAPSPSDFWRELRSEARRIQGLVARAKRIQRAHELSHPCTDVAPFQGIQHLLCCSWASFSKRAKWS